MSTNTETPIEPASPIFVAWADGKDEAERIAAETPDIAGEIDRRNGWVEPEDEKTEAAEVSEEMLIFAANSLREILTFCLDVRQLTDRKHLDQVLMRFLAVAWLLRPELLGNETLSSLAKTLGVTRSHLSQIASLASRRWHYQARVQRGAAARANHATAAVESWKKRR